MKNIVLSLVLICVAFGQTTLNMSQDLVRLGIASTNMVPNQPSLDAGPIFFLAVVYAQSHQIGRVIADPGSYYFRSLQYSGAHVGWDKLSNLTIDLQGSDLYFSFPLVGGMVITNSTNLVLENFTADYDPLPFTQVRVVAVDAAQRRIHFAVDGNWQNPSVLNAVFALPPNGFQGVEVHIFRNGRPIPGATRMHAANPVGSAEFTAAPDPGVSPSSVFAQIRPGDIAFLGMRYSGVGVGTLYCTGCTFRNISVYAGGFGGFDAGFTQSSLFEHIYAIPRPGTDRLASSYRGLGFPGPGQGNQVRLNRMIRTMDNGLEYNTRVIGTVRSQTDNRTLVLEGTVTSQLGDGGAVPNGSAVAFQRISDGAILTSAVTTSAVAPPYSGQPYELTFTFDRDLPASVVGTVMYGTDPSQHSGNTIVERNALEEETDCCGGFWVVGLSDSVFRGNYIRRSAFAAVHTQNSLVPGGFNSPPATNFTISNNVMDGPNWTASGYPVLQLGAVAVDTLSRGGVLGTASPQQNISVTGNFIADSGSAAVWLGNTNGGSVSGNYFLNPNSNPAVQSAEAQFGPSQPLVVQASMNIATGNNIVDQTSGRMWVTDVQYRELAAYAPGASIRLNAYEVGTFFPAPTVTLTDADGNTTTLTIQNTAAHSIDVQIPASAGLGGAYLTLTSGSLKYFGTLFLDSVDNIPTLNGCTYEVSPALQSVGAGAGNLPILVITQAGCSYQVLTTGSFVSPGAGATGTAVISVGFAANSGAGRNTTIEVAGQPFTVSQTAPSTVRPIIQAIYDVWNYASGVAPGTWVAIAGTALAPGPPRTWNLNGIQQLPTTLNNVTVSFNGTPAALYYVSPTQINALVPATIAAGAVQVIVQSNGVSSSPFTITATTTLPAIYAPPNADGTTFFVTAALQGTATLIGNSATDARVLRAAQPGDILDLYMIGLGATSDASKFVTNQVFSGAYPLNAPVTATVGGETVFVLFAGLTSPGLYLVRIAIPIDLAPGRQTIQVAAGGSHTRSSVVLVVGSAP